MAVNTVHQETTTPAPAGEKARWYPGFESREREFVDPYALTVEGTIPAGLTGALYRIGPARHEVYGERYQHWFDGDGMVHQIALDPAANSATYRARFVDTTKKQAEDRAGRRIYAGFGTPPPGNAFQRMRHFKPPNAANTNLIDHAGRFLALCEGGQPHRLDPDTLETVSLGEDDLGILTKSDTFTAHPRIHPWSGAMVGFGMRVGPKSQLRVYRVEANTKPSVLATLSVPPAAFVHDFALTETRAVFVLARRSDPSDTPGSNGKKKRTSGFSADQLKFLLGRQSVLDAMKPKKRPADIVTIDLRSGAVERTPAPDGVFGISHVANAFDTPDGGYVVDGVVYPDVEIIHQMVDLMAGRETDLTRPRLQRVEVSPSGAATATARSDEAWEFPRVERAYDSQEHDVAFGATGFLGAPVRVDSSGATVHALAEGEYGHEPIPVTKQGATTEGDCWLVAPVLVTGDDGSAHTEVRVIDGANMTAPPVARMRLPEVLPFDFHGTWRATPHV